VTFPVLTQEIAASAVSSATPTAPEIPQVFARLKKQDILSILGSSNASMTIVSLLLNILNFVLTSPSLSELLHAVNTKIIITKINCFNLNLPYKKT
jgi:hypothetical protein